MSGDPRIGVVSTLCAALLAITACADEQPETDGLDPGAAAVLADGAERLADQLEIGDGCAALDEAAALLTRARDGVAAATVPAEIAREVEDVVIEVTGDTTCEDDAVPDEDADEPTEAGVDDGGEPEDDEPDGGKNGNNNGKGKGNSKGKNG